MVDKYTREELESLSGQHRSLLYDKLSDEIRYKRREVEQLEETLLLLKIIRNELRVSK